MLNVKKSTNELKTRKVQARDDLVQIPCMLESSEFFPELVSCLLCNVQSLFLVPRANSFLFPTVLVMDNFVLHIIFPFSTQ